MRILVRAAARDVAVDAAANSLFASGSVILLAVRVGVVRGSARRGRVGRLSFRRDPRLGVGYHSSRATPRVRVFYPSILVLVNGRTSLLLSIHKPKGKTSENKQSSANSDTNYSTGCETVWRGARVLPLFVIAARVCDLEGGTREGRRANAEDASGSSLLGATDLQSNED